MLKVFCPPSCPAERAWILKVLLAEFLGLEYFFQIADRTNVRIEADGRALELPDTFFAGAELHWLKRESLPRLPLKRWNSAELNLKINVVDPALPVIYGEGGAEVCPEFVRLKLDIFGSAFFMLSRYEEAVKSERDDFDRFPATASLAGQEDFLDRPLVNEYLEILWSVLNYLWPGLVRKRRESRVLVSCDMDMPYSWGIKSVKRLARQIGGDLIRRKNPLQAVRTGLNYFYTKTDNYALDPFYNKLDWMMDLNEKVGNRMSFYFITGNSNARFDGCYTMDEPIIRRLVRQISRRGHEIGLHPSYHTYNDKNRIRAEYDTLRGVLKEEGVSQPVIGSRQHYLRWETPATARNLEATGLSYDTTLSFADQAGFRCGTCYEYPFYDVVERRELNLREHPLIVMDKSVFVYMGCSHGADGAAVLDRLKRRCRQFGGDFAILWHNNQFPNRRSMELYKAVIC